MDKTNQKIDGVETGNEIFQLNKHGGYADEKTIIMFKNPISFMVAHELGHAFSLPLHFHLRMQVQWLNLLTRQK